MINIITAINNPKLNEELKKEKNINIICKDIFYKEGILEILENTKEKINYIIIDYNLVGEIELNNLFNFINLKDEKIKIILTIKKENKINIENKKIIKIFYKNKINLTYLKNYNNLKNINNEIIKKNNTKIIYFFGENKVGKSIIIFNIAYYLKNKKNKILIIEIKEDNAKIKNKNYIIKKYKKLNKKIYNIKKIKVDKNIEYISLNYLINFKKLKKHYEFILIKINSNKKLKNYKKIIENISNIIIIRPNIIGIKNAKKIMEEYKLKNEKIIINNYNKYSIDKKIIKNIFKNKKIIGKIKYNKKFEELINSNFNNYYSNINFEIKKIIKKM